MQAEGAYLNRITSSAKSDWRERYGHLGPQFEQAMDQRFGAMVAAEPAKFVNQDRSYNVAAMKEAYFTASEEQAQAQGIGAVPTLEDYVAERQEWISKRRGYGYQRNEVSASMNS
jgi:hypothetical protein